MIKFRCKHTAAKEKNKRKIRARIKKRGLEGGIARLTVYKTPRHISAQVFTPDGSKVLLSASSLDKDIRASLPKEGGKIAVAKFVGEKLAEKIKKADLNLALAFDRSGFKFHGRIKALAEAVNESGIKC